MEELIKLFVRWLMEDLGLSVEVTIFTVVMVVFLIIAFVVCKGANWLEKLGEEPKE